jgi:NAD(P)-dependent dehydrogenase (short-subunit alcohol dehydrogenase family)
MSLKDRIVFVAGGCGTVGSGIALALLNEGAKVWVASRSAEKLEQIKSTVPEQLRSQLSLAKYDVSQESECIKLRDEILTQDKKINHVFSSLGGWWMKGYLSDQSVDEYMTVHRDMVLGHFIVYKTFAKVLAEQPGSTYTFITGGSGELNENGEIFEPKASLISCVSPGVYGLFYAANAEFDKNPNLRISELRIFIWVKPVKDADLENKTDTLVGNDFIGKFAVKITAGHKRGTIRVKTRFLADAVYKDL